MSDTKHGWVTPRADGAMARCGGPGICATCDTEREHVAMRTAVRTAPHIPTHASYLADVARAAHHTGKDLTLEEVAAGIRTGEENAKHNAAIRAAAGWLPIESAPKDGTEIWAYNGEQARMRWVEGECYALWIWADDLLADADPSPEQPTYWQPVPAAPGVSTVEDERQAFEAWAKWKKMPLARIGQQYDDFWVDHAWNGWQARAALDAPAAGDALDAARWRAYAKLFPEISASFLATHGVDGGDPLPTIKGASITGGYVVVTPAGWDADKATKLRDAILRLFPVNPAYTPRPSDELAAQRKGDA